MGNTRVFPGIFPAAIYIKELVSIFKTIYSIPKNLFDHYELAIYKTCQ